MRVSPSSNTAIRASGTCRHIATTVALLGLVVACGSPSPDDAAGGTAPTGGSPSTGGEGGRGGDPSTAGGGGSGGAGSEPVLPEGMYGVDGTDPDLPTTDLEPFGALLGETPILGLGESIHTSGGYYALKNRLIRYLVEEKGYRVFAMETPRTLAKQLGSFIDTCEGDSTHALLGIFSVFCDNHTKALVEWLCQYNQDHPVDKVRFFGFDMQQPWDDAPELKGFLNALAPADAAALIDGLAPCSGIDATSRKQYFDVDWLLPYPLEQYEACLSGLDALDAFLAANQAALEQASSQETYELALLAALGFRAWQGEFYYDHTDAKAAIEARDLAMAEVFGRLRAAHFPDQKAVLWAHNFHISQDHTAIEGSATPLAKTMGTALKERFGEDYQAVALTGYRVGINWPAYGWEIDEASGVMVENSLQALGSEDLFIDLEAATSGGFFDAGEQYWFGHPQSELMVPSAQYRAAFYLGYSEPMDAVFW